MDHIVGGPSKAHEATEEIQKICDKVKADAEKKAGKHYAVFKVKTYKTQLVAGTNYFMKVHVGGTDYVHLCVFQSLPCAGRKIEFMNIEVSKTKQDPI